MENKKKELFSNAKKWGEEKVSRRGFLKKAAYSAPVLMLMGQLVKPVDVHADGTGGPEGPPNGWNP
jgi:hypothetical protein